MSQSLGVSVPAARRPREAAVYAYETCNVLVHISHASYYVDTNKGPTALRTRKVVFPDKSSVPLLSGWERAWSTPPAAATARHISRTHGLADIVLATDFDLHWLHAQAANGAQYFLALGAAPCI
jgi:hypothetical protein